MEKSEYKGPNEELVQEVLALATSFKPANAPSSEFNNVEFITDVETAESLHAEEETVALSSQAQQRLFGTNDDARYAWLDVQEAIQGEEVESEGWEEFKRKYTEELTFPALEPYVTSFDEIIAEVNGDLDSALLADINFNISDTLRTVAWARAFKGRGANVHEQLFRFISAGYWVCGFRGTWPEPGRFVLWYPPSPPAPSALPNSPDEQLTFYRANIGRSKTRSKQAVEALELAADANLSEAQYQLALRLKDAENHRWLQRAQEGGHAAAALALVRNASQADDHTCAGTSELQWLERAENLALLGQDGRWCGSVADELIARTGRDRAGLDRALTLLKRGAELGDSAAKDSLVGLELGIRALEQPLAPLILELCLAKGMSEAVSKKVAALVKPSRRAVAAPKAATLSHLGGTPQLPQGLAWPTTPQRPLSFVAQIDLSEAELTRVNPALPHSGRLLFFVDTKGFFDAETADTPASVIYLKDQTGTSYEVPTGAEEFTRLPLSFIDEETLPFVRTAIARNAVGEETDAYDEVWQTVLNSRLPQHRDGEVHRLLGHPDAIQGDMTRRLIYADAGANIEQEDPALEAEAAKLRLLLQVDSESDAGMMWGDLGRIFFWIDEDDLAHGRWERVRCVLQCG